MRLLHPRTIQILASHPEFPKTHLAHAWSEVFKYLGSEKPHPKMFFDSSYALGQYLGYLYIKAKDCKLDIDKVYNLNESIVAGFNERKEDETCNYFESFFDSNYLFSDAVSLYFKGINIFPDIFGDQWRKFVPVESLKEIKRQVDKTLSK